MKLFKLRDWNYCWFKKLSKHKGIEIQLTLEKGFASWFNISFNIRTKCDHAGCEYKIELFKFIYFHIYYYDFRHWDDVIHHYCIYD